MIRTTITISLIALITFLRTSIAYIIIDIIYLILKLQILNLIEFKLRLQFCLEQLWLIN
jgi:hypothetical protein